IINDKNNITAIEKQEIQNLAQPKTYDEVVQRDKNENATLESYRDQYVDIAEIKEAEAQKQLLLEYRPEVAKAEANASAKDTFTDKQGNTHNIKDFANSLHTQAKEQENHFKVFLQSLKTEANTIIDTHITKSIESIESKIRRKNGNTDDIADFLRASILVDTNKDLDTQLLNLVNALEKQGIRPNIELKHRTSGYKGLHLQFEFNGIKSEIQLHTKQGWEIKKKQDEIYQVLRENALKQTLSEQEYLELEAKSVKLGQANDFSIKDFASFELNLMVSSNSETSVLRTKSEALANLNQPPSLNSKLASSEPDIAYNRLDSTLSVKDNLSGGSGNKSLESMQNPLINNNEIIPQTPQEIVKQAKASGKSAAETKELLQKHNKEIQSIRTEIRKDIATRQKNIDQGYIDIVSSHHTKIGKKGGYATKMYLETDKEKQSYLYDGFNKESVDNYLQLVKENAPLKERNKALDKLVNERLEAEERFSQLQKQQEELEDKQLQAFDEESFIKSLEGKSKDELENIQGDLWNKSRDKNSDTPFPVIARMSNLVMWMQDKIPQAAFNNDELREAIKSLRLQKEYKDDINSIQYFKENRAYIEQTLNIKPIKEFGTNYAEHYHSGETAIQKLISEAQAHKESGAKGEYKGQVAGAFHRKELGDIDLVWGNDKIGLQKIVEKHLKDFADFAGNNPYEKMSNAINEIIQNGKLLTENGVNTLWYKNGNEYYLVGISKGFNKKGDNNWVITSYKKDNITDLQKEKVDKLFSSDAEVLSAQGKFNELETLNSTTSTIIPQ
ncbi:MAG: hypothetical protein SPJ16_10490, partial [Helicobacter sp.]|nr:hypothetical protein [Helicobacter sp.]